MLEEDYIAIDADDLTVGEVFYWCAEWFSYIDFHNGHCTLYFPKKYGTPKLTKVNE